MAQLTWNQVQAPNMRDANMLMSDAMNRQGIGGAMIAKSLGNIGQDIQNRRDAEYYAQMNQYANDPLGMAQALQNGTINQNGVSQDALQRGREYLSSAAANWSNNTNTAHTNMLNQQRQKYAYEVEAYKQALANGELGRADAIIKSVTSKDPTASAEIFDGTLSFNRLNATANMMSAATGRNNSMLSPYIDGIIAKLNSQEKTSTDPDKLYSYDGIKIFTDQLGLSGADADYVIRGVQAGLAKLNPTSLNNEEPSEPIKKKSVASRYEDLANGGNGNAN